MSRPTEVLKFNHLKIIYKINNWKLKIILMLLFYQIVRLIKY